MMNYRSIGKSIADDREYFFHSWHAHDIFGTNAVNGNIGWGEIIFWINQNGQGLEYFTRFKVNQTDSAYACKIGVRCFYV
ncbi:hypothetical protein BN961_01088 [Afipia felis]|uniref:Uncharacterized protein n=1 Tax=Afipia felis TaxID=1035 RepID=A0A090MN32_AFIFE|nr:hypothetical protein BN961_01088 [Afipia felis]